MASTSSSATAAAALDSPPAGRNSDEENLSNPGSPKRPRLMPTPRTPSHSQPLTVRKVLGGIPDPISRRGTTSASQPSVLPPRARKGRFTALQEEIEKTNEVSAFVKARALTNARKTQAEPELDQHIQVNVAEETSGLIKSVTMYNFMCHKSFTKEFHDNLNFIIGENGSGKSAVLSGILVGLGAKAQTTARTKAIKSLVKSGESFAKIQIELINRGLLDPDKYSEIITIERVFDDKGTSTYKIRSYGKWRPLKKAELDYILMALGIQLDNPVSILNQETARSFLRSKDPKDKYKLFYEGTLLKSCDDLLKDSQSNIEQSRENFNKSKEVIKAQNAEVGRLKNIVRKISEVDEMKQQLQKLDLETAWARVVASEKTVEASKKKLSEKDQKIKKYEENEQKLMDERQALIDEASPTNQQKEALGAELRAKQSEFDAVRREWQTLQKSLHEQKVKLRHGKLQEEKLQKSVRVMESNVEKLRKSSQEAAEERRREIEVKKEELEAEKTRLTTELNALKGADGGADQFRQQAEACRAELASLEEQMQGLNIQLSRLRKELADVGRNRTNKYAPYGSDMERLAAKIRANQNRFKKTPRGPLGTCFTVKDKKWLPIIEHVLGNALATFIVDNSQDASLLNGFIKDIYARSTMGPNGGGRRPNVFLMDFGTGAYDISAGSSSMRNHPTILDMLKIENNDYVVRNTLCDLVKAERKLLFQDKRVALEILKDHKVLGFPRTCIAGFTTDFYKITPDPNFRADALNNQMQGRSYLLQVDMQDKAKTFKDEITALEAKTVQLRPTIEEKKKELHTAQSQYTRHDEKCKSLARKCHQIDAEIQALLKSSNTRGPDINNYIEELNDMQAELKEATDVVEAAQKFLDENAGKLDDLTIQKSELEVQVQAIQEKISNFEGSKDLTKAKIEKTNATLQKIINLIRSVKADREIIVQEVQEAEQVLQERVRIAEAEGERVETERTPDEIKSLKATIHAKIAEAEKYYSDRAKIEQELRDVKIKYEAFQADFKVWYNLYLALKQTFQSQDKQLQKSVETITTSLQTFFKGLIGTRGYKGTLSIDNEKQELFYFVCPDSEASTRVDKIFSTNNSKLIKNFLSEYGLGLSGGECSFSTICFIISMWQAMQCPFFMLDEFDVFMDAFNRKASQNALISHAKRHPDRQFFFLTPLELTETLEEGAASIMKLSAPDRSDRRQRNEDDDDEDSSGPPRAASRGGTTASSSAASASVPVPSKRPRRK